MGVEQVAHLPQLLLLHLQLKMHQLAFHPTVRQHHHGDEAVVSHGDKLKSLHRHGALVIRHGIGRIPHQTGGHLPCPRHHLVDLLHLAAQRGADLLRLLAGNGSALHQLVDVQPVALGRGHAPRRGVGLLQIAHLHQIRQLVAHGGGADLVGHPLHNGLGADRLGRPDVLLRDDLQYLLFSIRQFHIVLHF